MFLDWGAMFEASLFADDPVDGTIDSPDRLGRDNFANHVVRLLKRVRAQSESSVLALIGSWGSGKSSVLDMVKKQLVSADQLDAPLEEPAWLVLEFNPWIFADPASLQNIFFRELRNALPTDAKWSEARKKIGEFGNAIAPFAALIPGLRADVAIKAAGTAAAGDQSVMALRSAAEEALSELARPMLVIMDDLDRLTPDELLLVFKLVRLVGRLPNVYYLLSYDESTLLDVLSRTDLVPLDARGNTSRPREYLEKIIQLRLDLPALRETQALKLVDVSLNYVRESNQVVVEEENFNRFRTAYHEHLRRQLTTPRAINRYFAQVDALYALLHEEVDFIDFLLLTWVRTQEPGVYALLLATRDDLVPSEVDDVSQAATVTHAAALSAWRNRLEDAGVSDENVDGVITVLSLMFLPIRSARNNTDYMPADLDEIRLRRGVGHPDYCDRYFSFGVPDDDIPDSLVRQALDDLTCKVASESTGVLRERIMEDAARVCRKLGDELAKQRVKPEALLQFLADLYAGLPNSGDSFLDSRRAVQFLASDLLVHIQPAASRQLMLEMCAAPQGLYLVATIIARAQHSPSTGGRAETKPWLDEATEQVAALLRADFERQSLPVEMLDQESWRLLWTWRTLNRGQMCEWLRDATKHKLGWRAVDIAARTLCPEWPNHSNLPAVDLTQLEILLGIDFALESIRPLGDRKIGPSNYQPGKAWEEQVLRARTVVDAERDRRSKVAQQKAPLAIHPAPPGGESTNSQAL